MVAGAACAVESDFRPVPLWWGGETVTARKIGKKKADRQQGLYRVSALVPYVKKEE